MSGPKWDDEDIQRLREDWAAGLGVPGKSKSGVTGKAKRLGLDKNASMGASQRDQNDKAPKGSN
jgi:hypothetical protein